MTFQPAAWPPQWPDISDSVNELLASGAWGRYKSPHQELLASRLAELSGAEFVRLCGSGSAAIEISLRAAGVKPGDGVALAAFDYPGNFRAIEAVGAIPVLVDLEDKGLSIDPRSLEKHLSKLESPNVRAVIASHLYGQAAQVPQLRAICDEHDWMLIEDACQTPGMRIGERAAGSSGHLATLSFGGSKPLTAGNGGAVLTNDRRLFSRVNSQLDRPSDSHPLSTLQAAALLPQLDRLDRCNQTRNATVQFLQTDVNPQLTQWTWLSVIQDHVTSTHYKVAWQCKTTDQRNRLVNLSADLSLPIGPAFRSMSGSSERRCRKPMALTRSSELGERAFVLDHSALLIEPDQYDNLKAALIQLHEATASSL